jgi:hypothetical protein
MKLTTEIKDETGNFIHVYDDCFSFHELDKFYKFARGSYYQVTGFDQTKQKDRDVDEIQIFSKFSDEDVENMGVTKTQAHKFFREEYNLDELHIAQRRVNLSMPFEKNRLHTDCVGITILCYLNTKWEPDWGGHTMFMEDNIQEVKHVAAFKPFRCVVFTASLPHMIMAPTATCPAGRYSLALQYVDTRGKNESFCKS